LGERQRKILQFLDNDFITGAARTGGGCGVNIPTRYMDFLEIITGFLDLETGCLVRHEYKMNYWRVIRAFLEFSTGGKNRIIFGHFLPF
jgi:hypothetical protein